MTKTNQFLFCSLIAILSISCNNDDDINSGDINSTDLNLIITLETEQDQIEDISNNAMTVFNGSVWSVGGDRNGSRNESADIWRSANAVSWVSVNSDAFSRRTDHTLTTYDNKLWVIGGRNNDGDTLGEVWSSKDGNNWDLVTNTPAFIGAVNHDVVVFNDRLYLISRNIEEPSITSVWSSTNGEDWQLESNNAFSGRDEFKAVVFNNAIYVLGGTITNNAALPTFNEIWMSPNGSDWSLVNTNTIFRPRFSHTATVYNGRVFVAGGIELSSGIRPLGELWYSDDMINWFEYESFRSDIGMFEHSALTFNDRLWLFFGIVGSDATADNSGRIISILEE